MKDIVKFLLKKELILFFTFSLLSFTKEIKIQKEYSDFIPFDIKVNIKNSEAQPLYLNYVFIKSLDAPIREEPSPHSKMIIKLPFNSKLKVKSKVLADQNEWYEVETRDENGKVYTGYISEILVDLRVFRFNEMLDRILKLENFTKEKEKAGKELVSINTYKPNPANKDMDRRKDKYGISADQNSKGVSLGGETIFIPDRSIVSIEKTGDKELQVDALSIKEKSIKIDKKDITRYPKINSNFKKVIAIDLLNENQGIFEKNSKGEWELISYTLNKTGVESTLGFETPRGYFIVPVLKFEMGYRDEYNKSAGIAKHAIRFSGGGYIHGTPINFEEDTNREFFLNEKDGTLGTFEGTRKCIRNNEKHIKFLFDWITNKKIDKTSNEQRPDENVMVIIF